MFFSTPLFCVSLIPLYSALRVLNLMKLLHPRNPRYQTGLTIVRLVSSLPVTVHISQFLLGLWTILTLTFTYLRSACSLQPTSAIMKTLPGRFRGPSGRAPFSDEGGFTFSEAPFEGTLHEGLKGASPSEGFKGASPSEGGA